MDCKGAAFCRMMSAAIARRTTARKNMLKKHWKLASLHTVMPGICCEKKLKEKLWVIGSPQSQQVQITLFQIEDTGISYLLSDGQGQLYQSLSELPMETSHVA